MPEKFEADPWFHAFGRAAGQKHAAPADVHYTCPMHPEIVRDAPGACPICGMALEPMLPSDEPSEELTDFTRRMWISAASAFLLAFLLLRDGVRGTLALIGAMRLPSLGVALCFATASTSFVLALSHTTVANILLMQAGVPLIAALVGRLFFGEAVSGPTWAAIAAVIAGVGIMVSDSLGGAVSAIGDGLALLIAVAFAGATVITRRHAGIRMVPAVFLACVLSAAVAGALAGSLAVTAPDMALLFAFGALNLGLGMALFVTGARLAPAALTALISMLEPVAGPLWVWLVHAEVPSPRTLAGGTVILAALLAHLAWQAARRRRAA